MRHDGRRRDSLDLPSVLRLGGWDESQPSFREAYDAAYLDQRLVEAQTPSTWIGLVSDDTLRKDVSVFALDSDHLVVAFVLAFAHGSGVELGPIGTVSRWRRHGLSSALLRESLARCRELGVDAVTLTVDGESPTRAHDLYLSHGFAVTEYLVAYRRTLDV